MAEGFCHFGLQIRIVQAKLYVLPAGGLVSRNKGGNPANGLSKLWKQDAFRDKTWSGRKNLIFWTHENEVYPNFHVHIQIMRPIGLPGGQVMKNLIFEQQCLNPFMRFGPFKERAT